MITVGDLLTVLRLQDEMTPAVVHAERQLGRLNNAAGMTSYQLTLLGRGLREAGVIATGLFTVPIVGASVAAIKFGGDFETVTSKLVSLAGVTQDELAGVKQHILDLAPAVGIGPVALAEAMYAVSSTVQDTKIALEILDRSARLSAAGMGEPEVVARSLTTILNAYGAENITAAHAADVLTRAIRDGGAEAADLAPVLADVIPYAAKMGVSIEQVAANFATLTKVGVPAGEAITQLNSVFAALTRETPRGAEALKSVGLSYAKLKQQIAGGDGLAAVLIDLREKFKDNDRGLFSVVGRLEALKNIMGTTGAMTATYRNEVIRMNDVTGEADQAFKIATQNFQFMWKQVVASLQGVAIELSTTLLPILKQVLEWVRDSGIPILRNLVTGFGGLPTPIKIAVLAVSGFLAILGPGIVITGQFVMAVGNISRAFGLLNVGSAAAGMSSLVGFLSNPYVLGAALALGGIALAIYKIRGNFEQMENSFKESKNELIPGIETTNSNLAVTIDQAKELTKDLGPLTNGFRMVIGGIVDHTGATNENIRVSKLLVDQVKDLSGEEKNRIGILHDLHLTTAQISKETGIATNIVRLYVAQTESAERAETKQENSLIKLIEKIRKFEAASNEASQVVKIYGTNILKIEEQHWDLSAALVDTEIHLRGVGKEIDESLWSWEALKRLQGENVEAADDFAKKNKELFESLDDLARSLDYLRASALAEVVQSLSAAVQGGHTFKTALDTVKKSGDLTIDTFTGMAAGALGLVSAIDAVTNSASAFVNVLGGAAAGSVAASAAFGGMAGPIGAFVGALYGLIKSVGDAEARHEALVRTLDALQDSFLSAGGGVEQWVEDLGKAGIAVERFNELMLSQEDIQKRFNELMAQGKNEEAFAFLKSFRPEELQKRMEDLNDEMDEWRKRLEGLGTAGKGFAQRVDVFAKPFEKVSGDLAKLKEEMDKLLQKPVSEWTAEDVLHKAELQQAIAAVQQDLVLMGEQGQAAFNRLGLYAMSTFSGLVKEGAGLGAAFDVVGPSLDRMLTIQKETGLSVDETTGKMLTLYATYKDNADVIQSMDGLNQIMQGLGTAGIQNQELFNAFSADAVAGLKTMTDRNVDVNVAMGLIQPTLQTLWESWKSGKFEVDAATEAMLTQAETQGIVGNQMRSVNEKILDVLLAIANVFGADIPEGLQTMEQKAKDTIAKLPGEMQSTIDKIVPMPTDPKMLRAWELMRTAAAEELSKIPEDMALAIGEMTHDLETWQPPTINVPIEWGVPPVPTEWHHGGQLLHTGGDIIPYAHIGRLMSNERYVIGEVGEYMIRKEAVDYYGKQFMQAVNIGAFPRGAAQSGNVESGGGTTIVVQSDPKLERRMQNVEGQVSGLRRDLKVMLPMLVRDAIQTRISQ